jgi:hypothetical protein
VGNFAAGKSNQLSLQFRSRVDHTHGLNHGLDLFAELFIGDTEDRNIRDGRMGDQNILCLLRLNIDAT